jgi:hypothetical protein
MTPTSTTTTQALSQGNWVISLANQKALKAKTEALKAVEAAQKARKRVHDDIISCATGKHSPAPPRISTKAFAAKEPSLALAALECVNVESDSTKHEFSELGLVVFKYSVRTTSMRLTQPFSGMEEALFPSKRSSALMAAKTVRYVYEVALELGVSCPEKYAEASRFIEWHGPQSIIKGRETRGAGIVMHSQEALELVKTALATAKERVSSRVDAATKYDTEMEATAAAAAGVAAGDFA